ncbi:MAG TPA: 30S ribosome-binding factor RbfA [Cyclobacteriaceae bacterium]|nr:30S ribosome-binding factor RbfA [Cyclobacteriaceae bacterium]
MESKRQQKFARMVQKELGSIFQRDVKNLFGHAFISVTTVRMSPDLSIAKVYLSIMMADDKQACLENIVEKKSQIRKELGHRIGKISRITPDLHFFIDDSVDYAQKIEKLLKEIKSSPPVN